MDRFSLPHGAKGIEGEDFVLSFGPDRIVFVPKLAGRKPEDEGREKHYTFSARQASGVIDMHETTVLPDGSKAYRTLFALREEDLPLVLGGLEAMLPELVSLFRPVRLGWLKHRNITIARGIDPVGDEDIAAVTRKRKRKLALDPQLYEQNVFFPKFLEEVYDFPDGNFSLLYRGRPIGIGFKKTHADGGVHLFWIKRRDLMRFGHHWQEKVINALRAAAIPQERYGDCPFLRA